MYCDAGWRLSWPVRLMIGILTRLRTHREWVLAEGRVARDMAQGAPPGRRSAGMGAIRGAVLRIMGLSLVMWPYPILTPFRVYGARVVLSSQTNN